MAALSEEALERLLAPYLEAALVEMPTSLSVHAPRARVEAGRLYRLLSRYLDLLMMWNGRTNLTAIRSPEQIVQRHFGESLFAARCVEQLFGVGDLLDFGAGAGFPGIPIRMYLPELPVVLAESQGKKAAFLRTAVRELGLGAEVWGDRAERMPTERQFGAITMRAVDDPERARVEAWARVAAGGWLVEMTTLTTGVPMSAEVSRASIPGTREGVILLSQKSI